VLENPNEVGVSTVREIAEAAGQAQHLRAHGAQVGFEGYEDFRAPFREAIRQRTVQLSRPGALAAGSSAKGAKLGGSMPTWSVQRSRNIEDTFRQHRCDRLNGSRRGDLGRAPGVHAGRRRQFNSNASNFTYLASTGMVRVPRHPRPGTLPPTIWPGPIHATC
jgi:hypothetical protein